MPVSEGNARVSTPPEQSEVVWDTRIEEAERVSEALGDEVRVIDNSRSSSDAERKITLTRQWTQSISLDMERATDLGGSVDAKLPFAIGFSASASQSIKRRYGVAEGDDQGQAKDPVQDHVQLASGLAARCCGWPGRGRPRNQGPF
jgi:hypothetical protein